jgi:hypothetical protein
VVSLVRQFAAARLAKMFAFVYRRSIWSDSRKSRFRYGLLRNSWRSPSKNIGTHLVTSIFRLIRYVRSQLTIARIHQPA